MQNLETLTLFLILKLSSKQNELLLIIYSGIAIRRQFMR